ncbi:hypothetical protein HPULCUR_001326 [Helicostylum pulchrum]|uniref:Uncharacterized protein n=1 Tax=Helicostylum pulchrum TaxID=562976 RepID=A0ABP9XMD8_9FUNG
MSCAPYTNTTAFTAPLNNVTWYIDERRNITWDSTLPVFTTSYFKSGNIDIDVIKQHRVDFSEEWLVTYKNIPIKEPSFDFLVHANSWNFSLSDYKQYLYKFRMLPAGYLTEEHTRSADIQSCIQPVFLNFAPPDNYTATPPKKSPTDAPAPTDREGNNASGKKRTAIYYGVLALAATFAAVAL